MQEKSQIKQKILLYLTKKGITPYEFYKVSGVTRGILTQNNGINEDNLARFLAYAADVNPTWLLTGEGEMLKTNRISQHNSVEQVPVVEYKDSEFPEVSQISDLRNIPTRPRIPLDAAAGSLSVALQSVAESDCEQMPVIPTLPKYDFTIVARGDSMTPEILSGDELACRFINEKGFIQWGRTHVLDTAQGVVVKRIFDANDSIVCRSSNPNYPDFPVSKAEIYHLALVVGLVRQV